MKMQEEEGNDVWSALFVAVLLAWIVGAIIGYVFATHGEALLPRCGYSSELDKGVLVRSFGFDEAERLQGWVDMMNDEGWGVNVTAVDYGWRAEADCLVGPDEGPDWWEG